MTVPYSFANATVSIPLSQLDANFNTAITLGNTAIQLGNTVTTLNNMTLANVTISSGNVTITNVTVTTANVTTGNITNMVSGNVTITGGSINGTTLGATTASTANVTTLTTSSTVTINGGTANGVAYLDGSKVLTTGSALVFDGTNFGVGTSSPSTYQLGGKFVVAGPTSGIYFNDANNRFVIDGAGTVRDLELYFRYTNTAAISADGPLLFKVATGGGSPSEGMRLTSTGLGIGTSSPNASFKLDVAGKMRTAPSSGAAELSIRSPSGSSNYISWAEAGVADRAAIGFANGSGNLQFRMGGYDMATGTQALTLDSSGNLGLGVTPSAWGSNYRAVEVSGAVNVFGNTGDANFAGIGANIYHNNTNYLYRYSTFATMYLQDNGTHQWHIAPSGTAGNAITFTQAMTLDANGSLAVGGTTVVTNNGGITATTTVSGSVAATLAMRNAGTGNGSGTTLVFRGVSNASAEHDYAYVAGVADDTTAKTGSIRFSTTAGSSPVERARITSGGDFLVGTTSNSRSARLRVEGIETAFLTGYGNGYGIGIWMTPNASASGGTATPMSFQNVSDSTVGTITTTASATAYNTSSDYRLKDNPQPLTGSGAFIDALKPKTWAWKSDGSRGVGFIAHEVQEVSPGSVVGEKDGEQMQAMEYGSAEFIANIIAELQSLRARVAQLEAK